jgi:hypothetical protein
MLIILLNLIFKVVFMVEFNLEHHLKHHEEKLLDSFYQSSDPIVFLRQNDALYLLEKELRLIQESEGPAFDASGYFKDNAEKWDQFFEDKPDLFFKFLNTFYDPLSIVFLKCQQGTLINMIVGYSAKFLDFVLHSVPYSKESKAAFEAAFRQNYISALKISLQHNKEMFDELIRESLYLDDDPSALQEITGLTDDMKSLPESAQQYILRCNQEYLKHASEDVQFKYFNNSKYTKLYLEHASENVRLKLLAEDPAKYLQHASEVLQEQLARAEAEKYLKHASEEVQSKLSVEDPVKYLKHASEDVQLDSIEQLLRLFDESSDQVGFLHEYNAWYLLMSRIEPDFDTSGYFKDNAERWDQFFEDKPDLFFNFLNTFRDPLSIVLSNCRQETLSNMTGDHFYSFENLAIKSLCRDALGQNYDLTCLLQMSFEHDELRDKKLFSLLILQLPEITDAILEKIDGLNDGLNDGLKFLEGSVQRKIVSANIKYLKHASEYVQSKLSVEDSAQYLKHVSEEVQSTIVRQDPAKYLKHVSEDVRLKLVRQDPAKYLKHVSENVQSELARQDPAQYLKHAIEKAQLETVHSNINEYLKHASKDMQYHFICKDIDRYLQHTSTEMQLERLESGYASWRGILWCVSEEVRSKILAKDPEKWLACADKKFQVNFLHKNGVKGLRNASEEVQLNLVSQDPEKWLAHALQDLQYEFLLCKNSLKDLRHASEDVQSKILEKDYEKRLSYANDKVQLEFLYQDAGKYLKYVSEDVREKFLQQQSEKSKEECKNNEFLTGDFSQEDREFMAESKQFDDNFGDNN